MNNENYCLRCFKHGVLKPAYKQFSDQLCACCLYELQSVAWDGRGYTHGLSVKFHIDVLIVIPRLDRFETDTVRNICNGIEE